MKVVILAGGNSSEREVSLRSGGAVAAGLAHTKHEIEILDPKIGLTKLLPYLKAADVTFPMLHGAGGEDGILQKFLEDNKLSYVGTDSKGSALCFDKYQYGILLEKNNIAYPKSELVSYEKFLISELIKKPYVLKPNDGGSSIDTFIVRNPESPHADEIAEAFTKHDKLLLQELKEGYEITVGVFADKALPVIEIIPPSGKEFDYETKYNGETQELCPPKNVSVEAQKKAQLLALQIHKLSGCRDMSRTDMIVSGDGSLNVLETNTIPGFTAQSLLPKAANLAGFSMTMLCNELINLAFKRR